MPSGIILSSGSVGATKEAVEEVLTKNGYEAEKPEPEEKAEATAEESKTEVTAKTEEEEAEEHRPSRRQRAVDKATRELQKQLKEANERLAALEGKKAATDEPKIEAPKRENFKSDEEFEDAKFNFRYKHQRAKEQAEENQRELNNRLEKNFTDYKTAVEEFKDEHDDWDEVTSQPLPLSDPVYYAIVDLGEEGPPVTYYLGQHPEELNRLAEMTPYRAAIEVGRLADKIKKGEKPVAAERNQKPKPKLPEPVKPVSTSATASSLTSKDAATSRNYRAFKAAQHQGR